MAAVHMIPYMAHDGLHRHVPQRLGAYPTAAQEPRTYAGNPTNAASYSNHNVQSRQQAHYRSSSAPWGVEEPAGEARKPLLPPISNLLGIADGEQARINRQNSPPRFRHVDDRIPVPPNRSPYAAPHALDRRPSPPSRPPWIDSAASASNQTIEQAHGAVPVRFRHNSAGDRARSPSTLSTGSASSLPPRLAATAVIGTEPGDHRTEQRSDPMHGIQGNVTAQQATSPTSSPYIPTSNGPILYSPSYPSPKARAQQQPEDPYKQQQPQRPLPTNFPPHSIAAPPAPSAVSQPQPQAAAAPPPPQQQQPPQPPPPPPQQQQPQQQQQQQPENAQLTPSPWHHHHYMGASTQATFPQSQDRYICQTCSKAFSRPSSLKIHSHSHTGEKPFRCAHEGCGKAFSVRSNMKRHERGCHSGLGFPPTAGGAGANTDAVMGGMQPM